MTSLAESMRHRDNSLDVLRLLAAWLVLFSHQFAFLGWAEPTIFGEYAWGEVGLAIFFFLSGGLVWGSWCRDPNWRRFFIRRCLRIFPGLIVVVLLCAFVLGPALTNLSWQDYWSADGTWTYFKTILLNNQKGLPGVFEKNPYDLAVNGSLWSLSPEFFAYVMVAVVGSVMVRRQDTGAAVLLCMFVGILSYYIVRNGHSKVHYEVIALFGWGAVWARWMASRGVGQSFSVFALALVFLAFVFFAFALNGGVHRTVLMLSVALIVAVAYRLTLFKGFMARLGDISYGVYIYAFPVQQTLVHFFPDWHLAMHLCGSTGVTVVLAALSWRYVESVALLYKPSSVALHAKH